MPHTRKGRPCARTKLQVVAACAASLYKYHHGRGPHAEVARSSSLPELPSEQRLQPWAASGCPATSCASRMQSQMRYAVAGTRMNEDNSAPWRSTRCLHCSPTEPRPAERQTNVWCSITILCTSNEINPHARNLHSHHGHKGPVDHLEQATCSRTANTARGGAESGLNRRKIKQHGHVIRLETSVLLQLNAKAIRWLLGVSVGDWASIAVLQ